MSEVFGDNDASTEIVDVFVTWESSHTIIDVDGGPVDDERAELIGTTLSFTDEVEGVEVYVTVDADVDVGVGMDEAIDVGDGVDVDVDVIVAPCVGDT